MLSLMARAPLIATTQFLPDLPRYHKSLELYTIRQIMHSPVVTLTVSRVLPMLHMRTQTLASPTLILIRYNI